MTDKIKKYCEGQGSSNKSPVESNCVLEIGTENKSDYKKIDADRDTKRNWNGRELYDETKLKYEHILWNESQGLHIKHEINENEEVDDSVSNSLPFTTTNTLYCRNNYIGTDVVKKCQEENSETASNYVPQVKTERKLNCGSYNENQLKFEHPLQIGTNKLHIKREFNENEEVDDNEMEKLSSSLQFRVTNLLYGENGYIDTNIVKEWHKNEQSSEIELNCNKLVESEIHSFNVKHEEIDVKTKDEDTTRFQDNELIPKDASVITTYQCDMCTFKTIHNSDLTQHMLIHKDASVVDPYSCVICRYKARRKAYLRKHMLTHRSVSEVTMYACGICTFKTKYKGSLKSHMLIHKHTSELTMYSCKICTYKSKSKSHLSQHMFIHEDISKVTTYSCKICTYKSRQNANLTKHMMIHKNESEVTMFACEICTFKTKRRGGLKQHMLRHKNALEVTMYSCEICTFKSKRKGNLKLHTLIHKDASEVTTYSCEKCTYKAKRRYSLKKHMSIHKKVSEVTMHSCAICTYKTKHKDDLEKHNMSIHENASEVATHSDVESVLYVSPNVRYME